MNTRPDVAPPSGARRRALLYAGVAGTAAVAGVGLAWLTRSAPPQPAHDEPALTALWNLSFKAPDDSSLPMRRFVGKPLLLNFWATWCPPCVEELPLLDRFFAEHSSKGWQVVGIAADQAAAVRSFLSRSPVTFPVALAGMDGIYLSRSLGNHAGGLPFTIVLNAVGQIVGRKIGRVDADELGNWVRLG